MSTEQRQASVTVSAADAAAGYRFLRFARSKKYPRIIKILSICARNATTTQKIICLGYRSFDQFDHPLTCEAQLNNTLASVTVYPKIKVEADSLYVLLLAPVTSDVLHASVEWQEFEI